MTFTRDHLFIGDRWVEPEGGAAMPVINPATEQVIGSAPVASAKDTASAVAAARQAFDEGPWSRTTPKQRGEYIRVAVTAAGAKRTVQPREMILLARHPRRWRHGGTRTWQGFRGHHHEAGGR